MREKVRKMKKNGEKMKKIEKKCEILRKIAKNREKIRKRETDFNRGERGERREI